MYRLDVGLVISMFLENLIFYINPISKFKEMQVFKMILYKLILLLNELNISLEP